MEGEQFSLCWNNFHSNLSSGFHSLLKAEDLVDVTLAAEGKYIKAHKTVLSVCSPYFKELFRVNPCKHPIVILQGVNYEALEGVLQFMYKGEVSVNQDEIPTFMKVAELLQIKGLTNNNSDGSGSSNGTDLNDLTENSTSTDPKRNNPLIKRPRMPVTKRSRPSASSPRPDVSKASPVVAAPLSKKQALDVTARSGDVVNTVKQEPEDTDDSRSYEGASFSEGMDVSSMLHTSLGETSDAAGSWSPDPKQTDASSPGGLQFIKSRKGHPVLIHNGHMYTLSQQRDTKSTWVCVKQKKLNCEGCVTTANGPMLLSYSGHNHAQLNDIIQRIQAFSCSPTS